LKNGTRIVDIDTHVQPAMELLQQYASPVLRDRWGELEPYLRLNDTPRPDVGDYDHPSYNLSVAPYRYERMLNQPSTGREEARQAGGKSALEGRVVAVIEDGPGIGIMHDNNAGRLKAMDREGIDRHLIIPGTFGNASTGLDVELSWELCDAYGRYIVDYCAADPDRLKATILVNAADPQRAATAVKQLAAEKCVAAVTVLLPEGLPVDDPSLAPIWTAMGDEDLPMLHHSFFYEPPYFPGYRDVWDNVVVARAAAHPWGAQRLVAYLVLSGMLDRYPNLRIGFAEVGAGWLPFWLNRLRSQAEYMAVMVSDMKRDPVEYAQEGRICVGYEFYEGEAMVRGMIEMLGENCVAYQSDFPHPQCNFPESPDPLLEWGLWDELGPEAKAKFFAGNAERFMRIV
jgi:predicted TIM-barrel fold metal-dependent hydrolase